MNIERIRSKVVDFDIEGEFSASREVTFYGNWDVMNDPENEAEEDLLIAYLDSWKNWLIYKLKEYKLLCIQWVIRSTIENSDIYSIGLKVAFHMTPDQDQDQGKMRKLFSLIDGAIMENISCHRLCPSGHRFNKSISGNISFLWCPLCSPDYEEKWLAQRAKDRIEK
jgi:hypothetical protein